MKFEAAKNKRLIQFKELKEAVITNTVRVEEEKKPQKKEADASLLAFE